MPYLMRENLAIFTEQSFIELHSEKYLHNWHIQHLTETLEACYTREIKRLIINEPPRSMKSMVGSVAFPAWGLGKNPSLKFICGAYSADLQVDLSMKTRDVVTSDWYRRAFPKMILRDDQNEKTRFDTTERGYRISAMVGGGRSTGFGADFIVVDDPLMPTKAMSKLERDKANKWMTRTIQNRLNDQNEGVIILIMHRVHHNDPSGILLEQGDWHHICLPAENNHKPRQFLFKRPYVDNEGNASMEKTWEVGEVLHPERMPKHYLDNEKKDSYNYAGQFMQTPVPEGGGMVKNEWFKRYTITPPFEQIALSWDTASKAGELNDPSVCTVWGVAQNANYLLEVYCARVEYPDLKRAAIGLNNKWNPNAVLIEDKSSGQSLIQDMRRETKMPIIPIMPEGDKVVRLARVSPLIEAGRVFLPESAQWLHEYEFELCNFPKVDYKDRVDSTSQFLEWIRGRGGLQERPRIRTL